MTTTEGTHVMDILSQEHTVILRVLACLERIVDKGVREARLDGDDAREALEFFQTYADDFHHAKEEDRLFTALVEKGLPRDSGPVAVMCDEHERGRAEVQAMLARLDGAARGEAGELTSFSKHAVGFIELLCEHIGKEDNVLFPMARNFLDAETSKTLLDEFERAEAAMPAGTRERMLVLADELCRRYGVDKAAVAELLAHAHGSCGAGGCGHQG